MLSESATAPGFELSDEDGRSLRLSEFRGRWVVLWWYPEAKSSGCTIQARAFQVAHEKFLERDAVVLGASFNTTEKNHDFGECESLAFPLLSDPERVAGTAYDVVRKPDEKFADKPRRVTYLIDPEGRIARSYLVTDVASHPTQVLADLESEQARASSRAEV
jgi:peroxiredoxin Q/BCP